MIISIEMIFVCPAPLPNVAFIPLIGMIACRSVPLPHPSSGIARKGASRQTPLAIVAQIVAGLNAPRLFVQAAFDEFTTVIVTADPKVKGPQL